MSNNIVFSPKTFCTIFKDILPQFEEIQCANQYTGSLSNDNHKAEAEELSMLIWNLTQLNQPYPDDYTKSLDKFIASPFMRGYINNASQVAFVSKVYQELRPSN